MANILLDIEYVDKLKKRNAELEAEITDLKDSWASSIFNLSESEMELEAVKAENERYKKDNAYLIDQLPVQKHQKYLEGMERAAEIAEQIEFNLSRYNTGSMVAKAIRAEIKESS